MTREQLRMYVIELNRLEDFTFCFFNRYRIYFVYWIKKKIKVSPRKAGTLHPLDETILIIIVVFCIELKGCLLYFAKEDIFDVTKYHFYLLDKISKPSQSLCFVRCFLASWHKPENRRQRKFN